MNHFSPLPFVSFVVFGLLLVCGRTPLPAGQYAQAFQAFSTGTKSFPESVGYFTDANGVTGVADPRLKELELIALGTSLSDRKVLFKMPVLDPGEPIKAFSIKWNAVVYGVFPSNFTGGWAFHFSSSEPPRDFSSLAAYEGLSIGVNTNALSNPGFTLYVRQRPVASVPFPSGNWGNLNDQRHFFEVDWKESRLTFRMNGNPIFDRISTKTYRPEPNAKFSWAAISEKNNSMEFRLDNITAVTGGTLAPLASSAPYSTYGLTLPGETEAQAFDNNINTKWITSDTFPTVIGASIAAPASPITQRVAAYTLTTANDVQARDPLSWEFQFANDDIFWVGARAEVNQPWLRRGETRAFLTEVPTNHRRFRLNITANNGASFTQLAEFKPWEFVPYAPNQLTFWRERFFGTGLDLGPNANSALDKDPDRDGMNNLLEFAFDTDPLVPTKSPIDVYYNDEGGRYYFNHLAIQGINEAVELTIEWTFNLTTGPWISVPASAIEQSNGLRDDGYDGTVDYTSFPTDPNVKRRFIRVRARLR
jgi:hypothetical protein